MQLRLTPHGNYLFAYNGVLEALRVVNISLRTLLIRRLADASPRLKSWVIDDYLLQKNPTRIILRDGCSTYQTEVDGCSIANNKKSDTEQTVSEIFQFEIFMRLVAIPSS